MLPGFIDPHTHIVFNMFDGWCDLGPFIHKHSDQVMEKLKKAIADKKPGEWITGHLLDRLITPGGIIDVSKKILDKLAPENPIFILETNGHVAHVNSKAFEIGGITV